MSTVDSSNFLRNMIVAGVCGAVAVPIQTFTLMWAHTLFQQQKKHGGNLNQLALQLYRKGGLKSFYKGVASSLGPASLSRFGDTATNFMVLNFFSHEARQQNCPLFLQSAVTWMIASTWRICLVPLALAGQSFKNAEGRHVNYQKSELIRSTLSREYKTRARPEIISLYSWFAVQNYLDRYLPSVSYGQNQKIAFIRYGFIGFCSMITFDLCQILHQKIVSIRVRQLNPNLLLGEGKSRIIMKGFHGIVFCSSSHFMKQTFFQRK